MVESCSICQENRRANPQPEIYLEEVPLYPFQAVGTDLFELQGTHYLLTVDYYSKWVNIKELTPTRAADVIMALDSQFADYGIPEVLLSDNGPQYANSELNQFAQRLGFRHTASSPAYPASNGQAERSVQKAKIDNDKDVRRGSHGVEDLKKYTNRGRSTNSCNTTATTSTQNRTISEHGQLPQQVNTDEVRKLLQQKQAQP